MIENYILVNNVLDILLEPSIDTVDSNTRNDTLRSDASFLPAKLLTSIDEEEDMVVVDDDEDIDAALNAMCGDTVESGISDTDLMSNEMLRQISNQEISNDKLKTIEEEHLRKHSKSGSINHDVSHSHDDEFERKFNDNDNNNNNDDKPEMSAIGVSSAFASVLNDNDDDEKDDLLGSKKKGKKGQKGKGQKGKHGGEESTMLNLDRLLGDVSNRLDNKAVSAALQLLDDESDDDDDDDDDSDDDNDNNRLDRDNGNISHQM